MKTSYKLFFASLFLIIGIHTAHAQKACCSSGAKASKNCSTAAVADDAKACCATKAKATTSGCTPSQCRGAKTKFGEAKVISALRLELVELKAKMEDHSDYTFSNDAITVHDIIGETDDESLNILLTHVSIIESEIAAKTNEQFAVMEPTDNKAKQVKQLGKRIAVLSQKL